MDRAAERDLDVDALRAGAAQQRNDIDAFTDAYRRHVQVGATIDDVRIAPFEILACGNTDQSMTLETRSHQWHLEQLNRLAKADESLFVPTAHLVVSTTDEVSRSEGADWWRDIVARGGEGMVVKPSDNLVRDNKGRIVAPGLKVRGPEYLRIIYGPGYQHDLRRLRSRDLTHKRSLALREYQLSREALARHTDRDPLWRTHECVFGVLALESEPTDTRL